MITPSCAYARALCVKREGEGRKGKKMGDSGERELRKTPEGKLRRKEYEKKG